MGLRDLFRRRPDAASSPSATPARTTGAPDSDDQPGSVSSQLDVEGRGPVTLDERTKPGGQASPDTNQGKTEPMPASVAQGDPNAAFEPPDLDSMNVGGADPQVSSHPAARTRDVLAATPDPVVENAGTAPHEDRPALDPASTTKLPEGPERPAQVGPGKAQRQPGSLGASPEQQETDVHTGAARMRPGGGPDATPSPSEAGDSQGVAVPHPEPMPGTSEESPIVHGVRAPQDPQV